jgi:hypothetical protein
MPPDNECQTCTTLCIALNRFGIQPAARVRVPDDGTKVLLGDHIHKQKAASEHDKCDYIDLHYCQVQARHPSGLHTEQES